MIQLMMLSPRTRSRRKRRPADKAAQRRRDEVAKLRTQGLTFAEIGTAIGVSRSRAHQLWRDRQRNCRPSTGKATGER
jgi:hypothetical protein